MRVVSSNTLRKFFKIRKRIHNDLIYLPPIVKSGNSIEISMKWTTSYSEQIMCYTNNIYQKDGGTHLSGFKSALTRTINNYSLKNNGKQKYEISGDDCRRVSGDYINKDV